MKAMKAFIGILCVFLFFLSGCENSPFSSKSKKASSRKTSAPAVSGTVVAQVNTYPITLEDLNEEIQAYNDSVPATNPEAKIEDRQGKIDYLKENMVRRTLLYQEALDRGLDRNPDIQKALEKTKQQLLVLQLVQDETEKVNVTPQEIQDYYDNYKEQMREPEQRKLREIVVISEAQAKDILIRILQGEDFASLARQYSKAASAANGGDLGFIQPGEKFRKFDEVAFSEALEVDQVSSVFRGDDGYYIIKVEAKRGGGLRSLSDMRDDIERLLKFVKQQQRIEELVGNISANAKIEITEDKIK